MILKNAVLIAEIDPHGAELKRLYDRRQKRELLWNGDARFWGRVSPVLFPNVGKTFGNVLRTPSGEFPTKQHGFARDSEFVIESSNDVQCSFVLRDTAETRTVYPYSFALHISYTLSANTIEIRWTVENPEAEALAFTIGGHPAFLLDGNGLKADHGLLIPDRDMLEVRHLDPDSGCCIEDAVECLPLDNHRLSLSEEMFIRDALILDGGQIERVSLLNEDGQVGCTMVCENFPNFGIWSVKDAPFVCLEPWCGRADNVGFMGAAEDKPGVTVLKNGEAFTRAYRIEVL